jgi:membrane protease YdiL (CAAX protease family)
MNVKRAAEKSYSFSASTELFLFLVFIGLSFLTFNVGGYNNFVPENIRPLIRIAVFIVLAISTYIARKIEKLYSYWRVLFSFTISSLGLTAAWYLGRWYQLIPGISVATVEGAAIAKLAEVLPIVIAILAGVWVLDKDLTSIFFKGGNLRDTIKLGLVFSPLGLIPFIVLGGFGMSGEPNLFSTWIPWILLFSIANSLMEELMIRGLFLRKYSVFFGQRGSLLLTSIIFSLFHFGLLENTDFISASTFYAMTFILGLSWGYITQKSDSIWGSVLAHMISDAFGVLAVFGTI